MLWFDHINFRALVNRNRIGFCQRFREEKNTCTSIYITRRHTFPVVDKCRVSLRGKKIHAQAFILQDDTHFQKLSNVEFLKYCSNLAR